MSSHDAAAYYADHYSAASADDWRDWHRQGIWPPVEARRALADHAWGDGHGVVYRMLAPLAPFHRVLDIGCSAGNFLLPLKAAAKEAQGVDINTFPGAWDVLKEHYDVHCQQHDFDKADLPFPDGHFSAVTMIMVLEHVFNVEHAVKESARVLEPGGHVVIQVPNLAYVRHRIGLLLGRMPITANAADKEFKDAWDGQHLHNFTLGMLGTVLRRHGLLLEQARCFGRGAAWRSLWPALLGADLTVLARKTAALEPAAWWPGGKA